MVLRNLGVDPTEVVAEVGLDLTLFDDPDNLMSYATQGRLLSRCVRRTGCSHFGLLVGQLGRLSSLGLVGFLVQHSPDVWTALRSLVRYLHLHVTGAVPFLTVDDHLVLFGYEISEPQVEATDQIADGALAMMFNIMRSLCGPEWKPTEVLFVHRAPENVAPFRRHFGARLRFDAEQNALAFPDAWLKHRVATADPELRRFLQKQIDALDSQPQDDFPAQVRRVLRTALVRGQGTADQVAALFSMHSRTLNRRLSAFGTRFQAVVDEVRFEIAKQMLEDSAMRVSEIATALGYTDASAFARAFRRWSGTTPARWRTTQRAARVRKERPGPGPRA